jgi:hypothetical protein
MGDCGTVQSRYAIIVLISMLGNFNSSTPNHTWTKGLQTDAQMVNRDFKSWTSGQMYRTSYRDMHKKHPQKPKSYVIPGYGGYVPSVVADNMFSKSTTELSKETFNRTKYQQQRTTEFFPNRPFTTNVMGRTLGRLGGGLDDEYHTATRFHGNSTAQKGHPNTTESTWTSVYRKSFVSQEGLRPKIFRTTDLDGWKTCEASKRPLTQQSGFVQNKTAFDGHGWLPIKQLHGDTKQTEYSTRYNSSKPYHPQPLKANEPKLKKRELVY